MPANVNTMMSRNETPWHREGNVIMADEISPADAIVHAGLDWKVGLRPTYALMDADSKRLIRIEKSRTVVRLDNEFPLGVVGTRYRTIQNRDAFAFLDGLVASGEISIETAGALGDGQKVWVLARFKGADWTVGGDDLTKTYILFVTGHDGATSAQIILTNVRVVCANTLAMALAEGQRALSIRHSGDVKGNLNRAQDALALAQKQSQSLAEMGDALLRRMFTATEAQVFANTLIPAPVALDMNAIAKMPIAAADKAEAGYERALTRATNKQTELLGLLDDETNKVGNMQGSWWALLNAATGYSDHIATGKKGTDEVARSLWGSGAAFKAKAMTLATDALAV